MKGMTKKLLALLLALMVFGSTVTAAFAQDMSQSRDIDVVVKKITDGYANVYSATISMWSTGRVQAGEFGFKFSSSQLLSTTKLKLHQITAGTEGYIWFLSRMGKLGSKIAPFDIYCVNDNGIRNEFSRSISVTMTLPGDYQDPALYYLDTSGAVKEISTSRSDSSFNFTVSQSGYYVLLDRADAAVDITYYAITASADKGGTITPKGSQIVEAGTEQTFLISAEDGYRISNVKVDGIGVGAVDSYTFSDVQANHTIHVTFKRTEVNLGTIIEDILDWLIGGWFNP